MKAVSYYKEEFGHDLLRFSSATSNPSIACDFSTLREAMQTIEELEDEPSAEYE